MQLFSFLVIPHYFYITTGYIGSQEDIKQILNSSSQ